MKKQFTTDWFRGRKGHLEKYLAKFKDHVKVPFLEIGCWEGQATCWMADNFPQAMIEVIDPFIGNPEHPGKYDLEALQDRFDANTKEYGYRIKKHVGRSIDVLPKLKADRYEFIYVDGLHEGPDVLQDAIFAWRLLKSGGVMIFDDYNWHPERKPSENPRGAIDLFLQIFEKQINVLYKGSVVVIERK